MKRLIEKMSILSLSVMLVSTFAVSPALPAMISFFEPLGISGAQVEFLITVTSLAIMVSLLVNPYLERYLPEPVMISLGLMLIAFGGSLPLLTQSYAMIFLGRLILGTGLGFINARAINIISTHYEGQERLQVLGFRGAAEVLGSASLTALVGLLLPLGWTASFAIYLVAFLILGLYLAFVPKTQLGQRHQDSNADVRLPKSQWQQAIFLGFIGAFVIHINTMLTLKIPLLIEGLGLGTAAQSSSIISAMMLMGILAGLSFSFLVQRLGRQLLGLSVLLFAGLVLLVSLGNSLLVLGTGAILSGFCYSTVLTIVFNQASEHVSARLLNKKMTIVLVGCNLGGASSSILPAFLEQIFPNTQTIVLIYAVLCLLVGVYLLARPLKHS